MEVIYMGSYWVQGRGNLMSMRLDWGFFTSLYKAFPYPIGKFHNIMNLNRHSKFSFQFHFPRGQKSPIKQFLKFKKGPGMMSHRNILIKNGKKIQIRCVPNLYIQFKIVRQKIQKMSEQVEQHILRRYSLIKKLGSGAYGHVWKVTDKKTSQTLALKKIFDAFQHSTDAQRTFREIVFLHELNHPNVIKLHNVIKAENDKDLYLVFQFMEADLHNAIGQKILKDIHNRFILYQIVKGIKFLHSAEIIHRDLKPSNVLLNSDCHLKICDFGLARSLVSDRQGTDMILTEEVATRWYRAPEVLLGSQCYEKSADIWSVGCILGQVLIGKPMFPGNSTLNQLQRIISFTGNPSKQDILSLNSQIALSMISSISQHKAKNPKDFFKPDTPNDAIALLSRMLQFNPKKRPSAQQILKHPYLAQFHNVKEEYDSPKIIYPPVSDNKKLNLKQYRQLIYERIRKIYRSEEESVAGSSGSVPKMSTHSSSAAKYKEQAYYSHHGHNPQYQADPSPIPHKQQPYTPIRHSTGKMKTTSYSSSCSSFNQFTNPSSNLNSTSNTNTNTNPITPTNNNPTNNTYNSFYNSDSQQFNKIHKKSSLKQILRNKKYKEEITGSISNSSNKYNNSISVTPSAGTGTGTGMGSGMGMGGVGGPTGMGQQSYVQKYYKKPSMSATIYKENKLARHI